MAESLHDTLPLPQRLALTYAPARARQATLALFAFDSRLGQAVAQASEPIMAQMRLAWWRDQLKLAPNRRERSDALICALDPFSDESFSLSALIDGWELLLSEELTESSARSFASARAQAFLPLRRVLNASDEADAILRHAQQWALADLASGISDVQERSLVLDLARDANESIPRLTRVMRPLSVLSGLSRRSLKRGGTPLLDGAGSALAAIRLGLTGR